jgi:hypothetical protein
MIVGYLPFITGVYQAHCCACCNCQIMHASIVPRNNALAVTALPICIVIIAVHFSVVLSVILISCWTKRVENYTCGL